MSDTRESIRALVAAEHGGLESLFAEVFGSLRKCGEGPAAQAAFAQLRDQLEAHLAREDRLYYPMLSALRPAQREPAPQSPQLTTPSAAQLAQIESSLTRGELSTALGGLESLASLFAVHEAAEDQLLTQIDKEIRAKVVTLTG